MSTTTERFSQLVAINCTLSKTFENPSKEFNDELLKYRILAESRNYMASCFNVDFIQRMAAMFSDYTIKELYEKGTNNSNWIYKEFIHINDFCDYSNLYNKAIKNHNVEQAQEVSKKAVSLSFPFDDYEVCTADLGNLFDLMKMVSTPNQSIIGMACISNTNELSVYNQLCLARILNLLSLATSKITTAIECVYNQEHLNAVIKMTKLFCLFDNVMQTKGEIAVGSNPTVFNYTIPNTEKEYAAKIATCNAQGEEKIKKSRIVTTVICGAIGLVGSIPGIAIGAALGYFLVSKIAKKKIEEQMKGERVQIKKNYDSITETKIAEFRKKLDKHDLLLDRNNLKELTEKIPQIVYLLQIHFDATNEIIKNDLTAIPEKYIRDDNAINQFIEYFDDGRVETMKEAVNLYVSETKNSKYQEQILEEERKRTQTQAQIAEFTKQLAMAEEEKQKLLSNIAKEHTNLIQLQQKQNNLTQERNDSLNEIKDSLKDLKRQLDN